MIFSYHPIPVQVVSYYTFAGHSISFVIIFTFSMLTIIKCIGFTGPWCRLYKVQYIFAAVHCGKAGHGTLATMVIDGRVFGVGAAQGVNM